MKTLGIKIYETYIDVMFGNKTYAEPEITVTIPNNPNDKVQLEVHQLGNAYFQDTITDVVERGKKVAALVIKEGLQ